VQRRFRRLATALLPPLLILVVWTLIAMVVRDRTILPTPLEVWAAFQEIGESGELLQHVRVTLQRIFVGFVIAGFLGLGLGIIAGRYRPIWVLLYPINESLRPIPGLAIFPVLLIMIGVGDQLVQTLVVYGAFFPIWTATVAAVTNTREVYREAALTLGASPLRILWEVVVPEALPGILAGLRTGLSFAWMSIVGAELLGANSGLGYLIVYYQNMFVVPKVIAGMVMIGLLGFLLDRLLQMVQHTLTPWTVRHSQSE
jgi:ABC-type nitrate/sulfonate/bicarbonate transport system permease component